MSAVQPALDGTVPPPPRPRMDDYDAWVDVVRPTFEEIAASGRRFLSWEIKVEYKLPDPPDPDHQWGDLMGQLRREGIVKRAGWGETRDGSGVRRWIGTRAHITAWRAQQAAAGEVAA